MNRPQPDFNRFLKVVCRQGEPDRVPFGELFHDGEFMLALQGPPASDRREDAVAWRWKFWRDLGYDYASFSPDFGFPTEGLPAPDTAALSRGDRSWVNESTGLITTWEEFERYPWPAVTDASFATLEEAARQAPEGMKIVPMIPGGPFENVTFLMGFEMFSYALVEQPDLVAAILAKIDEVLTKIVETTVQMEAVGAQWLNDDLGFKSAPMASPAVLRQYIFPQQKKLCEIAHRAGKPILLHSCGKLDVIMDDLIDDVGIDAKHSYEDVIMPVWEAKKKWGSRMALIGGVDMDVLARGSEDQVRAYTRRCIEGCAPGGGWALGSGNTVANYVPVKNFLAMLDEGWKCGRYE